MITPVVLCGGSGSRLWPLSRQAMPKQFIPLIGGKSLLQLTFERLAVLGQGPGATMLCVSAEDYRFLVKDAAEQAGVRVQQVLEPCARNTAAALTLAALVGEPDALLLFCPSDHYIPDAPTFAAMVESAVPVAHSGRLVIFGVTPHQPSTGYGYIEMGPRRDRGDFAVARFEEKPPLEKAVQFLASGRHLWNAGIFLARADALISAMQRFAPDILQNCAAAMAGRREDGDFLRPDAAEFARCRAQSIDYAVMEHADNVSVIPFAGRWSDVGSWNSLAELYPVDAQGNSVADGAVALDCESTFVRSDGRTVVAVGTKDLVIVDTADATLVAARGAVERVKDVVSQLQASGIPSATQNRKVARPWGWYDSIDSGPNFQVKRLHIKPGASISLQFHRHRAEHWVVVSGEAQVTRGDDHMVLTQGQSAYIAPGVVHRLANRGPAVLEMIEVQSGTILDEDDIVRMADDYGRAGATAHG